MSQAVLDTLLGYEQATSLVDRKALTAAVRESPLTFVVFSCLATELNKEELVLDFFKTWFFDGGKKEVGRAFKHTVRMVEELEQQAGTAVTVYPILVDTEPRRVWGWQAQQEEVTTACQLMAEQATESGLLPTNWHPVLWSELEAKYDGSDTFNNHLERVRGPGKHHLLVQQQEEYLKGFTACFRYPLGLSETAKRKVAGYAFEGVVLQEIFPRAILLQSEVPWQEKDALYQWWRDKKKPLPVIHPFPL